MPMHRKVKRATVLVKRMQGVRKYYKERSYKPLYEKLKNNNSHLAKALSEEKQTCQSLFTQNIALIAEVQELRLACNTRDNVISNILKNAKETLKMLVTMSGYVTNTISSCQEFAASNNLRLSSVSAVGRKESSRRLSTKSPAKGVVKPMVSGHTITKPTINLSRVNMQHINNTSRLSDIQEVATSTRNEEMNDTAPIAVSIPITQLRYENGRTCRMPERLTITSPRIDADNDQRLGRRRSRHSKRMSGSFSQSKSNRWSSEAIRNSTEHANLLGSPTVKLNDVSKLLQNSQSINIRRLFANSKNDGNMESQENDDASHDISDRNLIIPEMQISSNSDEENETSIPIKKKNSNMQTSKKISSKKHFDRNVSVIENSRVSQNNTEDPLEGPSWLFNDNVTISHDTESEPNLPNISDTDNHAHQNSCNVITYDDVSNHEENTSLSLPNLGNCVDDTQVSEEDTSVINDVGDDSSFTTANDSFCTVLPITISDGERNNAKNEDTMNFAHFVTLRRRHSEVMDEETEDFTLLLSRQPKQNMHFDINELRLPVIEQSIINPTDTNNIDSEITTTIQRINIPMPSISNHNMNESELDQSTIKLPLISVNDLERISTPENSNCANLKNKKLKISKTMKNQDHVKNKKRAKTGNKSDNGRDPSAAKVVLEKLNESHVKLRTPSPDDTIHESDNYMRDIISNQEESTRDSENSVDNSYFSTRPRRRKAPVNLTEPKLNKKLRRNV